MTEFSAVMIIGHFVISVFNVPLGDPLYQFIPFPNMEICQEYTQFHALPTGRQISLEHKMFISAECITREAFEFQMNRSQSPVE